VFKKEKKKKKTKHENLYFSW